MAALRKTADFILRTWLMILEWLANEEEDKETRDTRALCHRLHPLYTFSSYCSSSLAAASPFSAWHIIDGILDKQRFGLRIIRKMLALSASCVFPLQLHVSLPISSFLCGFMSLCLFRLSSAASCLSAYFVFPLQLHVSLPTSSFLCSFMSLCLFRLSSAASSLSTSNLRLAFLTDERQLSRS